MSLSIVIVLYVLVYEKLPNAVKKKLDIRSAVGQFFTCELVMCRDTFLFWRRNQADCS